MPDRYPLRDPQCVHPRTGTVRAIDPPGPVTPVCGRSACIAAAIAQTPGLGEWRADTLQAA